MARCASDQIACVAAVSFKSKDWEGNARKPNHFLLKFATRVVTLWDKLASSVQQAGRHLGSEDSSEEGVNDAREAESEGRCETTEGA